MNNTTNHKSNKQVKWIQRVNELKNKIIEQKNSIEFKAYLDTISKFHRYSAHNCMMIRMQSPDASQVAGYITWNRLGRRIKRGACGIRIFVPHFIKRKQEDEQVNAKTLLDQNTGLTPESHQRDIYFTLKSIYDISQTYGKPLPAWDVRNRVQDVDAYLKVLTDVVIDTGLEVKFVKDLKAFGIAKEGQILIHKDENPATQFCTLTHELTHQVLHINKKGLTRQEKELQAETASYIVATRFGIESTADKYLAAWVEDNDLLKHLEPVRQSASFIITEMEDRLGLTHKNNQNQ